MNQSWDPKLYSRDAAFVSNYGTDLLSMLDPAEGRSLLDLGCGEGALTEKLLSLGWNVTGVDSSEEQVRAALMRGISAKVMDGEHLKFDETFDYVRMNVNATEAANNTHAGAGGTTMGATPGDDIIAIEAIKGKRKSK